MRRWGEGGRSALTRGLARSTGGDGTAAAQQEKQFIFFPRWRRRLAGRKGLSPGHHDWDGTDEEEPMPIGATTTTTTGRMPLERRGREARTTQIPAVCCVHVVVRPRAHDSQIVPVYDLEIRAT